MNGLCIYGDRVSPRVNYAIGVPCLIFGYAYYFTNPEHQNTRNIEGFMSMACLAAGILAALAFTLLLSSLVQTLTRTARAGGHREDEAEVRTKGGETRALGRLGLLHLPRPPAESPRGSRGWWWRTGKDTPGSCARVLGRPGVRPHRRTRARLRGAGRGGTGPGGNG